MNQLFDISLFRYSKDDKKFTADLLDLVDEAGEYIDLRNKSFDMVNKKTGNTVAFTFKETIKEVVDDSAVFEFCLYTSKEGYNCLLFFP